MDKQQQIKQFLHLLMQKSAPGRPSWNVEVLLGHVKPSWNYIDGCMVKAIMDMYFVTEDEQYLTFVDAYIDYYIAEDGTILGYNQEDYNSDNINEGKILFDLYRLTKKEKYRQAINILYEQLRTHPRTSCGNFWHKMIYPNQVWLDGLYMVQPFYIRYEKEYNQNKNVDDIFRQFQNVYDLMRDQKTGLLYHGYDSSRSAFWADKKTGLSSNFWTRSLGWYAMALVDTLEYVEAEFVFERQTLEQHLKAVLDALMQFEDEKSHLFYQVTDAGAKTGNYFETSGTCAIAYCLMKGARLGYLPHNYFAKGKRIYEAVVKEKLVSAEADQSLVLKDICLVAGLGVYPGRGDYKERDGSYEYYVSEPRVNNDAKGVAPLLFAFSEIQGAEPNV